MFAVGRHLGVRWRMCSTLMWHSCHRRYSVRWGYLGVRLGYLGIRWGILSTAGMKYDVINLIIVNQTWVSMERTRRLLTKQTKFDTLVWFPMIQLITSYFTPTVLDIRHGNQFLRHRTWHQPPHSKMPPHGNHGIFHGTDSSPTVLHTPHRMTHILHGTGLADKPYSANRSYDYFY